MYYTKKKGNTMKLKLIPVVFTAALTSLMTLFAVSRFQLQGPHFGMADNQKHTPASFAVFGNSGTLPAGPVNFEGAAESSVKAVVHINTSTKGRVVADDNMDDVFSQLFGRRQYYIPPQQGSGSGVVISPDGYIVTNNHVVADASDVTVTFNDRYTTKAKVVGTDPSTDIAVLKVEGEKNVPYMEFGNSDDVKLGQWVLAVGYPLTLDATVTAGIISAKGRSLGINRTQSNGAIESFIQTDAAVNPGNSGGALVNTGGQLIGINSAIASPTGSYAGYSYAIPSNIVRKAVNDLVKYGSVQRGYMGIKYVDSKSITPEELTATGMNKTEGVYVKDVMSKSGAAKAGLRKGDIITQINGVNIHTEPELQGQIARYQPGDNVSVMYLRDGKSYTTTVQLTNLNGTTEIIKAQSAAKLLGATLRPLSDKEKHSYNLQSGVVVADAGSGPLAKQTQIQKGFIITGVNNNAVNSINDVEQAMAASKNVQIAGFYPGKAGMYYYGVNNADGLASEE
jgi:serine protease Do